MNDFQEMHLENNPNELLDLLQKKVSADKKRVIKNDFYAWPTREMKSTGTRQFPHVSYSEYMKKLWRFFSDMGYVTPFHNYPEWLEDHNTLTKSNLLWIAKADKTTLNNHLFCLSRAEHFGDGYWSTRISNGEFLEIFKRIQTIGPRQNSYPECN